MAITFAALISPVNAEESVLGYCSGEYTRTGKYPVNGKGWIEAAAYIPPSILHRNSEASIVALRGALASKINVDTLVLWIRSSLKEENLRETLITTATSPSLNTGWNERRLDIPFNLDSCDGLYLGMSIHQKGDTRAISVVGSGLDNAFFAKLDKQKEWEDLSASGILSVEAIVDGEKSVCCDVGLLDATVNPNVSLTFNHLSVKMVNNGKNSVEGVTLQTSYSSGENSQQYFECPMLPGDVATVEYDIAKSGNIFQNPLEVRILSVAEGVDEIVENNVIKGTVVKGKKVLVEEFTTELCSNCPRVAGYLGEVLSEERYALRTVAVCHHSGYGTDWLTQPCDTELLYLYGGGSFAPGMAFDRCPVEGSKIVVTPDKDMIRRQIDEKAKETPHVQIVFPDVRYVTGSDRLEVSVAGRRDSNADEDFLLTVYLLEDNVKARRQNGAAGDFIHHHVIREYNSDWGDVIDWDGDSFKADFAFDLEDVCDADHLYIAAFVSVYDASDYANCKVDNAEQMSLKGITTNSGVESSEYADRTLQEIRYYSPDGRILQSCQKGMYIVWRRYSDGYVSVEKSIWSD